MYRSFNSLGECMGGSQRGIAWQAEAAAQAHGWARQLSWELGPPPPAFKQA